MIKHLILGASALALAAPALAQEVSVDNINNLPIRQAELGGFVNELEEADGPDRADLTDLATPTAADLIGTAAGDADVPDLGNGGNSAGVDQDGTANSATVDQDGGVGGYALIRQSNPGIVNQTGQTATVTQSVSGAAGAGTLNAAYIQQVQDGTANEDQAQTAGITQVYNAALGSGDSRGGNFAVIAQGGLPETNAGGNQNQANISQQGTGNDAVVAQGAVLPPDAPGGGERHNVALTQQVGHGNSAFTQQENHGNANVTRQTGDENVAYVLQDNASQGHDDIQNSDVIQSGSNNFAAVYQGADNLRSLISQADDFNDAFVSQTGEDSVSEIRQTGGNNSSQVVQSATSSDSFIWQTNTGLLANTATVSQATANHSFSSISQNGTGNVTSVSQ